MSPPEIVRLFDSRLSARLADLGFEAHPAGHFSIRLAPGVSGHFEVRKYVDNDAGEVGIWAIVGVRFDEVEQLVAQLTRRQPAGSVNYTVGKPLGFMVERLKLSDWSIASVPEIPGVVDDVVAACEAHAVPYMRRNSSIRAAISELSPAELGGSHDWERLAAVYALLGDYEMSRAVLDHQLSKLRGGGHPGQNHFKAFAQGLIDYIAGRRKLA